MNESLYWHLRVKHGPPSTCPKCARRFDARDARWDKHEDVMRAGCACGWTCVWPPDDKLRQMAEEEAL